MKFIKFSAGRIVGTMASVAGIIVLAFPITLIVENFSHFYDTKGKRTTQKEMKEARAHLKNKRMTRKYGMPVHSVGIL